MNRRDARSAAVKPRLGAPGVYLAPERPPPVRLGVPMDECAFVGVAPRGPAWEWGDGDDGRQRFASVPVAIRSWDDYRYWFGGFDGPGLLPFAVSTFFEQGGRVAHVVRAVRNALGVDGEPAGRAEIRFDSSLAREGGAPLTMQARNEGRWGCALRCSFAFSATAMPVPGDVVAGRQLDIGAAPVAAGTLLRITTTAAARLMRVVQFCVPERRVDGVVWRAVLDQAIAANVDRVEIVDATLHVIDTDPAMERAERFDRLGLWPDHPRWIGTVLAEESSLVELAGDAGIVVGASLPVVTGEAVAGSGVDRYELIGFDDVLAGVETAVAVDDAASVVVPDLYAPGAMPAPPDVEDVRTLAGPRFTKCEPISPPRPSPSRNEDAALPLLLLDPSDPAQLEEIGRRQELAVAAAERNGVVALIDAPPGLRVDAILRWRRRFATPYAAAYHPWLLFPRDGVRGTGALVAVPPSAAAAGIIARVELTEGLPVGPGNEIANGAVDVDATVSAEEHAELHWANVNVFRIDRDGVLLTAARTLATDRSWRQLAARRIVTMVERSVQRQLQWTVFEPNGIDVRRDVETALTQLLDDLYRAGAFAGATAAESYFVRTARGRDITTESDRGQLLCQVGVAPSESLEFIVVDVSRQGDGTLRTESRRG